MRPNIRFLFAHPNHFLALGFGSGLAPFAPGTFGTLMGWLLFPFLHSKLSTPEFFAILLVGLAVGSWACQRTGQALGEADPGAIVWDEILAIWLVLHFVPNSFLWQALAVGVFRFFDIVKPPPVKWADEHWKNGFGVMADDLIAAAYSLLILLFFIPGRF